MSSLESLKKKSVSSANTIVADKNQSAQKLHDATIKRRETEVHCSFDDKFAHHRSLSQSSRAIDALLQMIASHKCKQNVLCLPTGSALLK